MDFSYSSRRFTPLAFAVARGHLKSAQILIASGANVNSIAGELGTAIIIAAKEMQSECINLLANAGADVNMVGNYGLTAMMWAATRPYSQCHGMTKSVKVHRKDQSVNKNAYFYYFGQFHVFL